MYFLEHNGSLIAYCELCRVSLDDVIDDVIDVAIIDDVVKECFQTAAYGR